MKKVMFVLFVAVAMVVSQGAFGAPMEKQIYYQKDVGGVAKPYTFRFSLWDSASGGAGVWSEVADVVPDATIIRHYLGSGTPLDGVNFSQQLWVQVEKLDRTGNYVPTGARDRFSAAPYALVTAAVAGPSGVPVGTVIDWWRPDVTWPVPDGYQICDGSMVSDNTSPLFGMALPDLKDKFVVGVTDVNQIGISGGSSSHTHTTDISHAHGSSMTTGGGLHNHTITMPLLQATGSTDFAGRHSHMWLRFQYAGGNDVKSYWTFTAPNQEDPTAIFTWEDGIDNEGSGIYPLAFSVPGNVYQDYYTENTGAHSHSLNLSFNLPPFDTGLTGTHEHAVSIPALGLLEKTTSLDSNLPPYYGLLKIMRIR